MTSPTISLFDVLYMNHTPDDNNISDVIKDLTIAENTISTLLSLIKQTKIRLLSQDMTATSILPKHIWSELIAVIEVCKHYNLSDQKEYKRQLEKPTVTINVSDNKSMSDILTIVEALTHMS